jgi:hypothetical protein
MSVSKTPVKTSRTKAPSVARATASAALGSQSTSTPNGTAKSGPRRDHRGFRRGYFKADPDRVRKIVLVAEQQAVHAGLLQREHILAQGLVDGSHPTCRVVPRSPWQRTQMAHSYQRLGDAEDPLQNVHWPTS